MKHFAIYSFELWQKINEKYYVCYGIVIIIIVQGIGTGIERERERERQPIQFMNEIQINEQNV